MRNLKRVLSLALALVMMLGMMIIGANAASADFADADEITYTEAVDVMAAIGVLEGDGTNFNPTDILTREMAAKIICYMLMGPTNAAKLGGGVQVFDDVAADRWSASVVAYCSNLGIIAGYGDGNFGPADELTGVAFAKMLLVALGNDPVACGYVGNNWATSIAVDAIKVGLDLDGVALTDPLTREQAAQMAFTALNYSASAGSTGDWAYVPGTGWVERPGTATDSLASKVFGLQKATGVVTSNQATGDTVTKIDTATVSADGKITALAGSPVSYNTETGLDMIGRVVTVYYKTIGAKGTVYTVIDKSEVVTVSTAISSDATKMAAAFGKGTDDAAAVYNFSDYTTTTPEAAITDFTKDTSAAAGTYVLYGGEIVSYVAPAAGVGVVAKVTAYTAPTASANGYVTITGLAADGTYGVTASITLEKVGSTTADKVKLYDGIASGDYVYVTKIGTTATVVEKAEVVTETITARASDNSKVTVAGKEYSVAVIGSDNKVTANNSTLGDLGLTAVASATLGTTTYNVVLTSGGKVLGYYGYTPTSEANNYAVIQGISVVAAEGTDNWSGNSFKPATAQVKLALADGTSAVYGIKMTEAQTKETDEDTLKTALLGSLDVGSVVKYALAEGVISEITSASADETATELKKGSTLITGVAGKYLTAETVFIYWDSTDTTDYAITRFVGYNAIKNTGTLAAGKIDIVFNSDNKAVFVYVDLAGTTTSSKTLKAYIPNMNYSARYDATLKATVYDYTAYVDGVKTTLTAKSTISATGTAAAPYVATYTLTDGYLTAVAYIAAGTATDNYQAQAITYVTNDIVVANGTEYTYADAQVFVVAKDGTVSAGSVVVSDTANYDTYLVIGTAAGTAPAALSYIYYIAK